MADLYTLPALLGRQAWPHYQAHLPRRGAGRCLRLSSPGALEQNGAQGAAGERCLPAKGNVVRELHRRVIDYILLYFTIFYYCLLFIYAFTY